VVSSGGPTARAHIAELLPLNRADKVAHARFPRWLRRPWLQARQGLDALLCDRGRHIWRQPSKRSAALSQSRSSAAASVTLTNSGSNGCSKDIRIGIVGGRGARGGTSL